MSLVVHTPVPVRFRRHVRELIFRRLCREACAKYSKAKGGIKLSRREEDMIIDKLRAELEKRGFWAMVN